MRAERAGLALLLASGAAFVVAVFVSALVLLHWALVLAGLLVLAVARPARVAALLAIGALVVALAVGLVGAGVSLRGLGVAGSSGDAGATMLAALSGPLALAVFLAARGPGAPRVLGVLALAAAALGSAGLAAGAPDGLLGVALALTILLSFSALALDARRLARAG